MALPLRAGDVPSALALGVGCVPKSRHRQGLVLTQSIADNVTMPIANALGALGFIAPARRAAAANEAIDTLGVVTEGPDQLVSDLSGGNQQKVVMGRALSSRPSVLVLIDPTAGVNVKSKEALLRVIRKYAPRRPGDFGGERRTRGFAGLRPGGRDAPWRGCRRARGGLERSRARRRRSRRFNLNEVRPRSPSFSEAPLRGAPTPSRLARLRDLALLPALAVLLVIGSIISPVFRASGNINTILTSSAALALVVFAESLVIITGKFDLSLESIYGIAPAIGAMVVLAAEGFGFGFEWPTAIGILTVLVVGGLVGFINGFMVVKLRLSAFIVTLAMLIILRGMLVGATHGRTLFDLPGAFYGLMVITFLGLPLAVWLAALAFVIAGVIAHLGWDHAWDLTKKTLAYTNHTLLPEALEKWPVAWFEILLPRHLEIIYEINRRLLDEVRVRFPGDEGRVQRISLVEEGSQRKIRMANLAIVGTHSTNGVAEVHSKLLRTTTVKDLAEMFPERFNNKTNGVTPRRWLLEANPALARAITQVIGERWTTDLSQLKQAQAICRRSWLS